MNQLCKVCGEPAAGFHFGAFTCEGCKSFFGRTYNNVSGVSECKNGGRCEINKKNRTSCKSCRLRKCLRVGMSKSGSRYGRRSNWFKIHCLLSAQNGTGLSGLAETNSNNSGNPTNDNNNNSGGNSNGNSHHHHHHHHLTHHHHHNNNNNNHNKNHHHHHHPPPSSSSTGSSGGGGGHGLSHPGPDISGIERSSSVASGTSHHHSNSSSSVPPPSLHHPSFQGLSPDAKEQFLASLNRKTIPGMTPELFEYFRATQTLPIPPNGHGPKIIFPGVDDKEEEVSRTSRSPVGSLESPHSENSTDENKGNLPLFGIPPPGSPLDIKPHDFASFDLLTRDLLKLGYDPLRFWPAMLLSSSNLHPNFNPYRFMFPIPGGSGVPPGFQSTTSPNPLIGNSGFVGPLLPNGNGQHLGSTKIPIIPTPTVVATSSLSPNPLHHHHNRRFPIMIPPPPTSSLPLTPPISHHGSDEPTNLSKTLISTTKLHHLSTTQDEPIDLSAKTTLTDGSGGGSETESSVSSVRLRVKNLPPEIGSESDMSSDLDEDDSDRSS